MNVVMKRILILLVVVGPSIASADKNFTKGRGGTWDCKKDPVVNITAASGKFTFKGACTHVNITSAKSKITAEAIDELNLSGSKNEITVGTVTTINVSGSNNKITFKAGTPPDVHNTGSDNLIAKAGAPAPTTAAPVASGAAIDCSKNPVFSYDDNNGAFSFTGKCDKIMINGNGVSLKIESVTALMLNGNEASVEVANATTIGANGNNNTVKYKKAVKVANTGNGNTITQVR